jgi:hypothetical protein
MTGISEWLGLIGVVLGSALGYASSTFQESLRRRHEDNRAVQSQERENRIRLENRRFDVYTAVITAANRVHAVAKYPAVSGFAVSAAKVRNVVDPAVYNSQLNLSYESFNAALSPAFLMAGSEDVHRNLRELTTSTLNLMNGARDFRGKTDIEGLLAEQRRTLRTTEAAMRREIGLQVISDSDESPASIDSVDCRNR